MKVIIAFILCLSCANTSPYLQSAKVFNNATLDLHQCNLPVFVASHPELNSEYVQTVDRAIKHWNESVKFEVFMNLGKLSWIPEKPSDAFIMINVEETKDMTDRLCGATYYSWGMNGCMHNVRIHISPVCLRRGVDVVETIIRHELGHSIGLAHVDDFTKLMNAEIEYSLQHPVGLSEEEIRLVQDLYRR